MIRAGSPWRSTVAAAVMAVWLCAMMAPASLAAAPPSSPTPDPSGPVQPGQSAPQAPNAPGQQPGAPAAPAPVTTGPTSLEYRVAPGDVLNISVLGEAEVSGAFLVAPDGTIMMQMVGQVPASGLSLPELTDKVTTALKKFIRTPVVAISIQQTSSHQQFVYLLGQVNRPGAYPMQSDWSVASLMASAGGFTAAAALPNAFIIRQAATIPVNLEQLLVDGNTAANVSLQPGDVVIVPEATKRVVITGAVLRPGPYIIQPTDRLVDVLAAAGGPVTGAKVNDIGVIRRPAGDANAKPVVTEVNFTQFYRDGDDKQNMLMQPGDVIYVPPASGVNWITIINTIGSLAWVTYLFHY